MLRKRSASGIKRRPCSTRLRAAWFAFGGVLCCAASITTWGICGHLLQRNDPAFVRTGNWWILGDRYTQFPPETWAGIPNPAYRRPNEPPRQPDMSFRETGGGGVQRVLGVEVWEWSEQRMEPRFTEEQMRLAGDWLQLWDYYAGYQRSADGKTLAPIPAKTSSTFLWSPNAAQRLFREGRVFFWTTNRAGVIVVALVLAASGVVPAVVVFAFDHARKQAAMLDNACPGCGYSREGLAKSTVCPECGGSFDAWPH
jgi:hypothetical protein